MRCVYLATCWFIGGSLAGCAPEGTPPPGAPAAEKKEAAAPGVEPGEESAGLTAEEVRQELGEATETVEQYSAQKAEQILQEARANLGEVRGKIARLNAQVGDLQETAQAELEESIQNLEIKLQDAEQQLAQLRDAGAAAWTQARDDLQEALGNLEAAYEEAAAAFEKAKAHAPEAAPGETPAGSGPGAASGTAPTPNLAGTQPVTDPRPGTGSLFESCRPENAPCPLTRQPTAAQPTAGDWLIFRAVWARKGCLSRMALSYSQETTRCRADSKACSTTCCIRGRPRQYHSCLSPYSPADRGAADEGMKPLISPPVAWSGQRHPVIL